MIILQKTSRGQKLDNKFVIPLPHYSTFSLPNGKIVKAFAVSCIYLYRPEIEKIGFKHTLQSLNFWGKFEILLLGERISTFKFN